MRRPLWDTTAGGPACRSRNSFTWRGAVFPLLLLMVVPTCGCRNNCCSGIFLSAWEVDSGRRSQTAEITPPNARFAFVGDGTRVATWRGTYGSDPSLTVRIWSVPDGEQLREIVLASSEPRITQPVFSPNLRWLAMFPYVHGGQASRFMLWDLDNATVQAEYPGETPLGFSDDGRQLLTYGYSDPPSQERRVTWWDIETHTEIASFTVDGLPLKLHAGSGRLVVGFVEAAQESSRTTVSLTLVDTRSEGTTELLGTAEYFQWTHVDKGGLMAFSADGSTFALAEAGTIRVWRMDGDLSSPEIIDVARPETWATYSPPIWVALSPDGGRLLAKIGGFDGAVNDSVVRVQIWHVGTGQPPRVFDSPFMDGSRVAGFLPDGTLMTLGRRCSSECGL